MTNYTKRLTTRNERELLTVFYDEKLKKRRAAVPKLVMYARVCETAEPDQWDAGMIAVNEAPGHLLEIRYVEKKVPAPIADRMKP